MNAQDKLQHEQLEQAAEMARNLTQHLHRQHELKTREMFLKRKEIAHLNQLSRFQKLMQSAVAAVWKKMSGVSHREPGSEATSLVTRGDSQRKRVWWLCLTGSSHCLDVLEKSDSDGFLSLLRKGQRG